MKSKFTELSEIKAEFEEFLSTVFQHKSQEKRIDEVELHIFKWLMEFGLKILTYYIEDVKSNAEDTIKLELAWADKGSFARKYFSIFGLIRFKRKKVYIRRENKTAYPADRVLSMPLGEYSYNLLDWIGHSASDTDFRSSVELINRIFNHQIKETQAERISNKLAEEVEMFYEDDQNALPDKEGSYYAAGFDDKGIPILPADANRDVDSSGVRLGKGQKRGTKKSCTVSVTYSFEPNIRTAEEVIASLFREKKDEQGEDNDASEPSGKRAKNKHIRAFLSDKQKAMEYGLDNILARSPGKKKNIVILIDGDRGLEKAIDRAVEKKNIKSRIALKVLDFIHVVEYLWKAANIVYGEKSPFRIIWVKENSLLLLQGKGEQVLENLNVLIKHGKYQTARHRTVKTVIKYLANHKHMLNYKICLEKGYPISTGAIESACGHFVQSRMERNGMRWSIKGAKNILNLRAVRKNKDWDGYMKYYVEKQDESIDYLNFRKAA